MALAQASTDDAVLKHRELERAYADIRQQHAFCETEHASLLALNERLAQVNAATAELMAELEEKNEDLRQMNAALAAANAESVQLMAELEEKNDALGEMNRSLAAANAASVELMVELEERNGDLQLTNRELARANAHAAELMAVVELKNEEIHTLNAHLSQANARAADLIAERELHNDALEALNARLSVEIVERQRMEDALRQRTADLEASNEDLDAFSHSVAHDLRGPLGIVLGYAQIIESDVAAMPEAVLKKSLSSITKTAKKMISIIDSLMLLASVRYADAENEPVELADTVREALDRLDMMVADYNGEIVLAESWPEALGNAAWIEEVWVNYLSNALKYGGRPPRVELGANSQDDGTIRCWVRDNGHGLTPAEQESLFVPFVRLEQVDVDGHGLGLSIVRRIVEKMGGQVGLESEVGCGSVFSFTLQEHLPGA